MLPALQRASLLADTPNSCVWDTTTHTCQKTICEDIATPTACTSNPVCTYYMAATACFPAPCSASTEAGCIVLGAGCLRQRSVTTRNANSTPRKRASRRTAMTWRNATAVWTPSATGTQPPRQSRTQTRRTGNALLGHHLLGRHVDASRHFGRQANGFTGVTSLLRSWADTLAWSRVLGRVDVSALSDIRVGVGVIQLDGGEVRPVRTRSLSTPTRTTSWFCACVPASVEGNASL